MTAHPCFQEKKNLFFSAHAPNLATCMCFKSGWCYGAHYIHGYVRLIGYSIHEDSRSRIMLHGYRIFITCTRYKLIRLRYDVSFF